MEPPLAIHVLPYSRTIVCHLCKAVTELCVKQINTLRKYLKKFSLSAMIAGKLQIDPSHTSEINLLHMTKFKFCKFGYATYDTRFICTVADCFIIIRWNDMSLDNAAI
jgi:hypothetical protein